MMDVKTILPKILNKSFLFEKKFISTVLFKSNSQIISKIYKDSAACDDY